MTKSNYYLIIAVSLILSTISYVAHLSTVLVIVLMLLWIYCFLFSLIKINNRVTLFAFLVTFFSFLLSRLFINTLLPDFESDYTIEAANMAYSNEAQYFVLYSLVLSLVGLSIGYLTSYDKSIPLNKIENPVYIKRIRLISKRLSYILFSFTLIVTVEKILFIWTNGYVSYYLSFSESLPHVFYTLSFAYKFAFFVFLATMPPRKEAIPLILLYVLGACVSLLTGQRGAFITPLLFVLIYLFIRNSLTPKDPWIGRKGKMVVLISVPLLCASMFMVMLIRGEYESGNDNLLILVLNFFYQLGGSENIIGYSYDFQSRMPNDQWYSLGPILRYIQSNSLAYLFGFGETIQTQTVEMATRGHELGSFLTYYTDSNRYLSGGNIASSYVAELWLDFGFIGILLGNYIYGRILGSIMRISYSNVWKTAIVLIMINRILTAPRASFIFFIADCLSFSFLIMIIYMLLKCKGVPHYISVK